MHIHRGKTIGGSAIYWKLEHSYQLLSTIRDSKQFELAVEYLLIFFLTDRTEQLLRVTVPPSFGPYLVKSDLDVLVLEIGHPGSWVYREVA